MATPSNRMWWCRVCWLHCTEIEHQTGESKSGSCAHVFELYIVHEIVKGGFHLSEIVR